MNRLLGYLVTFAMLFVVFDGFLRLAGCSPQPTRVEFHPSRGWQNKQSVTARSKGTEFNVDVVFNAQRMRGEELPTDKPPGKQRVLFVGDSFTLGYTVAEEDLFLQLVGRELVANGHDVEVLNGGTEGFSTDQELLWFEEQGQQLKPDIVVFAPYLNDVYWNSQDHYVHRAKPRYDVQGDTVKLATSPLVDPGEKSWFRAHTGLGTLLDKLAQAKAAAPHSADGIWLEDAPLLKTPPAVIDRAWQVTDALIAEFGRRIKASGAKPVALLVPNRWEIETDAPLPPGIGKAARDEVDPAMVTNRFQTACERAGFAVVDPRGSLRAATAHGPVYFQHDWHWNERGNRVVAAELLQRFEQPALLGPGTGAVKPEMLIAGLSSATTNGGGVPTWTIVVGVLWLLLGFGYSRSYPKENPALAFGKVGLLIAFVAGVFLGIGKLAASMPPSISRWIMPAIVLGLLGFILVKVGKQLGVIGELYGTFLRRGHWYMLPMLVVMLSIGMLLVVAASSPFVAPFIYTLF